MQKQHSIPTHPVHLVHNSYIQTIELLQESVKTLQKQTEELKRQLENEKHDAALLLGALKEQLRYEDNSDTVAHSLPQEKNLPSRRIERNEGKAREIRDLFSSDAPFDKNQIYI